MGERPAGFVPDGFVPDSKPADKPAAASSWLDSATNFVTNFAHNVDPRPALKLLYDTGKAGAGAFSGNLAMGDDFAADLKGLGKAQVDQFKKGKQAYHDGRISEAVGHTIAGALPLVGPAAANAGEQIGSGDISGGLGAGAGLLAPLGAKYGAEAVRTGSVLPTSAKVAALPPRSISVPGLGGPVEPKAAAAVAEGLAQGVPLDAATATGRPIVATLQKAASDSIGGAGAAERFKAAQQAGLATVGEQLASKANERAGVPGPSVTPENAGKGAISKVQSKIDEFSQTADAGYGKLRAIEDKQPIPVDLRGVKAALEPMYRTMAVGADIAPLQGAKAGAVRAIARILEGPDVAGASEVDSALSDLKELQRSAQDTPGAAAANRAVAQVHQAVIRAVSQAGPDALRALNDGRQATTAKYAAIEMRDFLEGNTGEGVGAYGRTVAPKDANVGRMREIAKLAPEAMPEIGRAFLDDLMGQATADGGFQHAPKVATQWEKLGAETKALLFNDPAHVKSLDNFFRLAEKATENVNPSGSGKIVNIKNFWQPMQLLSSVPMAALSKLLYTEKGVNLLTQGFHIPLSSPAAAASYTARLAAAVKGLGGEMQPAMADDSQGQKPATIVQR